MSKSAISHSAWSWQALQVAGIPIKVHASLIILIAWIAYVEILDNGNPLVEVMFVLALLFCVLLHELGHALCAKRFGIYTREIVIYPFGGIATMGSAPSAYQELLVALAGPLVNICIAVCLVPLIDFPDNFLQLFQIQDFLVRLFIANCILVAFNLIPALPMDGGRVLRAILTIVGVTKATLFAGRLSQLLSLFMLGLAFWTTSPILFLIAVLVFTQATAEVSHFKSIELAQGLTAQDVMIKANLLLSFTHGTTIAAAFESALTALQPVFPVFHNSELIGLVTRSELLENGAIDMESTYVSSIMTRDFVAVEASADLSSILELLSAKQLPWLIVKGPNGFMGLIIQEKLIEYLIMNNFKKRSLERHEQNRMLGF